MDYTGHRYAPGVEQTSRSPDARWAWLVGRCRAAPRVLRARREARIATRDERRALLALGSALAGAAAPSGSDVERARGDVAALDAALDRLGTALSASLREDRADYAAVAPWVRPLVVGRGLADRLILRDRLRRVRRARDAACVRLGAAALRESAEIPDVACPLASPAQEARSRIAAATREAESLLSPFGGGLLPGPARLVAREALAFGRALVREARTQLVPRVPALFGLAAGWWVASTFTDSRILATLHSLGIGRGPRVAVDGETYRILRYALPILAAALCSYASARMAALVRARYGAVEAADPVATAPGPLATAQPDEPGRGAQRA
jgi:hypothetical protein